MNNQQNLFQVAAIWHPSDVQVENKMESKVIVNPEYIMAKDERTAGFLAYSKLPEAYQKDISQVQIMVRAF